MMKKLFDAILDGAGFAIEIIIVCLCAKFLEFLLKWLIFIRRITMAYLEELLPEFRKGEVSRDEVTFYEDKKDE